MSKTKAIILAAGFGTRMKSGKPKVIHELLGTPLVSCVIKSAKDAGVDEICVVVGHGSDQVKGAIREEVVYALQEEQLGTGDAVMMAKDFIEEEGRTLVLFGDTPLITSETLKALLETTEEKGNAVTVLSTLVDEPHGYGRIIRRDGLFHKSVEHKDATEEERTCQEINSGMYCFDSKALKDSLGKLSNDNAQGEYYLPDVLPIIMKDGGKVEALVTKNSDEILGINDRVQLAEAQGIMQRRINKMHMQMGVTIINPDQTYISMEAVIGQDTIIYPGTYIEGTSIVGADCVLGPNARLVNSTIGEHTKIEQSTVLDSTIGDYTAVGPFAYVRPNSKIGNHIKIGDFVEVKNAVIGHGTKISHLTYVGDADVGQKVNFGCGTVVVNYDGKKKHRTTIEDNAFIGCNTNLVSPVIVHEGAYTAAGSTVTDDVPSDALAIARARQTNIEGWVKRR